MVTQVKSYGSLLKRTRLMKRGEDGKPEPWTQYRLAKESGVSESGIYQIESGREPQDATKVRLATALGAPELLPDGL